MRLCVWSGPRNLSTAMMYAFGNRADCHAMDEPFYGAYLAETGLDHPMRDAVLAGMECDPGRVAALCAAPPAGGQGLVYQKHMAHHMLPGFPLDWTEGARHVFLIRHPARVIASYAAKREAPSMDDLGFERQWALFERIGGNAPVIEAEAVRADPEGALRALCDRLGLAWDAAMLSWPAGPRPFDGPWAPHWYGAAHAATGFAGPEGPPPNLPPALRPVLDAALPYWERLRDAA